MPTTQAFPEHDTVFVVPDSSSVQAHGSLQCPAALVGAAHREGRDNEALALLQVHLHAHLIDPHYCLNKGLQSERFLLGGLTVPTILALAGLCALYK